MRWTFPTRLFFVCQKSNDLELKLDVLLPPISSYLIIPFSYLFSLPKEPSLFRTFSLLKSMKRNFDIYS